MPIDYERIRSKMGDTSVTNLSSISLCDIDIISFYLRDTGSWMGGWYEEGIGSVCVSGGGGGGRPGGHPNDRLVSSQVQHNDVMRALDYCFCFYNNVIP